MDGPPSVEHDALTFSLRRFNHGARERGRFAPSPTGPLHFGSLITALASFLAARSLGGEWCVRIEDIDTPRVVRGAAAEILRALEHLGLAWDGPVIYQSARLDRYRDALNTLQADGHVYPCTCSRRDLAAAGGDPVYPGTCRANVRPARRPASLRLRVDQRTVVFHDLIQGPQAQHLASAVGDFVIRRADGVVAYQLAVVVDDAEQGITQIVRGSDLLDSTARQLYTQSLLGLPNPVYAHIPVALDGRGYKLSKQTGAPPLDPRHPAKLLVAALDFLEQRPPAELAHARPAEILAWALEHWSLSAIQAGAGIRLTAGPALAI